MIVQLEIDRAVVPFCRGTRPRIVNLDAFFGGAGIQQEYSRQKERKNSFHRFADLFK